MEITQRIRAAIAGVIDAGTHLDVAETTSKIAKQLGLSERLINYTHIELRNRLGEYAFRRIPIGKRMLFLPQCLRNTKKCKAAMGEGGWVCRGCGSCKIAEIRRFAEKFGYKGVFIVPGGSMVEMLVKRHKPAAVVGVSCFPEMNMAVDRLRSMGVALQGVLLMRDGCKDTDVNLEELWEKLRLAAKKEPKKARKTKR